MLTGRRRITDLPVRGKSYIYVALILLLATLATGLASNAHSALGWRGDFETDDFSQWPETHVQANPGDAVVVSNVAHQGRYAAKFTVSPGDDPIGSTGERAQVYASQSTTDGYEGREQWWAWSTMIGSGSVLYNGGWNDLTAFHQTGPTCPAPVHFALNYSWMLRIDAWGGPLDETTCQNPYRKTWQLVKVEPGTWYDIMFHVKWSPNPSVGFVEVYVNGKLVVPKTYTATLYQGQGVYLKQGLNRGSTSAGSTVVYNDGTRRGTSYSDVVADFASGTWPSEQGGSAVSTLPPPTISGSPVVGSTLTANVDSSSLPGDPLSVAYQWRSCDSSGGSCADLTGATAPTYVPVTANVGRTLRVLAAVKTTTATYSSTSSATAVVQASAAVLSVIQSITNGQALSGQVSWTATPSTSVSKIEFSIDGALKWTEKYSPFVFNGDGATLDTKTLTDGDHTFAVKAYGTNGTTATAVATATVANSSSAALSVVQSITNGQTLTGGVSWTATPSAAVSKIDFSIDGALKWTERIAPYVFNGDGAKLDTASLSNGNHTFSVKAYASDGTTASATATASVSNGSSTNTTTTTTTKTTSLSVSSSITDGQTLSGGVSWTATPSAAVSKIDFSIDGALKWTEDIAPYVFKGDGAKLDTASLSNGNHTFSVKAYASDGTTASATATASVSNGSSTTSNASSTNTTTTTTTKTTSLSVSSSITDGQTLSGGVSWTATPSAAVSKIDFSIDGALKWTEDIAPYVFKGDGAKLDTASLSNGNHTFSVKAYASDGTTASATATASVSNGSSTTSNASSTNTTTTTTTKKR